MIYRANNDEVEIVAIDPIADINTDGAPTLGPVNALVSIVVFDDFECPSCSEMAEVLKKVQASFPNKVKLVHKDFPLPFHEKATYAALAGLAAHRQGKFWEIHDLLFANQEKLSPADINSYAQEVGLDMHKFNADMADPLLEEQLNDELQESFSLHVSGTPTVFINGRTFRGRSYIEFKFAVEEELSR